MLEFTYGHVGYLVLLRHILTSSFDCRTLTSLFIILRKEIGKQDEKEDLLSKLFQGRLLNLFEKDMTKSRNISW